MRFLLALLLIVTAAAVLAEPVRMVDGDTIELHTAGSGVSTRLKAIRYAGAPGAGGRCGGNSARALTGLTAGEQVTCTERDVSRYGRTIATCATIDGQVIGADRMEWLGAGF